MLSCKSVFDKLEAFEMMKARSRSNPFETIGKGIFQNRAAMKMANMDTVLDYMFTDPRDEEGRSLSNSLNIIRHFYRGIYYIYNIYVYICMYMGGGNFQRRDDNSFLHFESTIYV